MAWQPASARSTPAPSRSDHDERREGRVVKHGQQLAASSSGSADRDRYASTGAGDRRTGRRRWPPTSTTGGRFPTSTATADPTSIASDMPPDESRRLPPADSRPGAVTGQWPPLRGDCLRGRRRPVGPAGRDGRSWSPAVPVESSERTDADEMVDDDHGQPVGAYLGQPQRPGTVSVRTSTWIPWRSSVTSWVTLPPRAPGPRARPGTRRAGR